MIGDYMFKNFVLYSFDVFDTLITRRTAVPKGIFDIIQDTLFQLNLKDDYNFSRSLIENYADIRIASEMLARKNNAKRGIEEITLDEIYEAFYQHSDIDQNTLATLKQIELKTEYESVFPIRQNISLIETLLNDGKQVILISDMYLSQADIRKMLLKASECFKNIPLYVSSEYRMTKRDETLFHLVHDKEYVDFSMWHHMGDNEKADVQIPKRLGIKTTYFHKERLWGVEREFLDLNYLKPNVQYSIGLAKNLRVTHRNLSYEWLFGCSVGGCIAFSYSLWLLNQCKELKISRLYFIARDGYIPKLITDMLIEALKLPIKTKYIHGSRKAWRMAAFTSEVGSIRRLVQCSMAERIRSVKDLAKLLQIPETCMCSYLPYELKNKMLWSFYDLHICITHLEKHPTFKTDIEEYHNNMRNEVYKYISQEIDMRDDSFAFVEVGGTGYTQECFAKLVKNFYKKDIHTFAFHIGKQGLGKHCMFHNFYNEPYEIIMEPLFRAPHGQTVAYTPCHSKVIPVLNDEGKYLLQYKYNDYIAGIKSYCQTIITEGNVQDFFLSGNTVYQFIKILIDNLNNDEMNFIKHMPFSVTENELKIFAPQITKKQIRKIYLSSSKLRLNDLYSGAHFPYSIMCGDEKLRQRAIFYRKNRKLLRERYRKIYSNKEGCNWFDRENDISDLAGLNIVLYGAGKLGEILYRELSDDKGIKSLVWLDANYIQWKELGYEVLGDINFLKDLTYDKLIIGMADPHNIVRNQLIMQGISNDKIVDFL